MLGNVRVFPLSYVSRKRLGRRSSGDGSPTRVHLDHLATLFALDVAAPVELAAAAVHHLHLLRVEPSTAAHELTAVDGLRGLVAKASRGSQYPRRSGVVFAEVGARVQVHQILIRVWLELRVPWNQDLGGTDFAQLHFRGAVKFLLYDVAHLAERWHGFPAGLHLAGARHAVAFAFHPHVIQNRLGTVK